MDSSEIDLFKFFIDKGYVEGGLLYTRSTVFTSLLVLIAGFAIKELALSDKRTPGRKWAMILVASLGVCMSVAWFFVTKKSIDYMDVWQRDARTIAVNNETIHKYYRGGTATAPPAKTDGFDLGKTLRFWEWQASTWYKALAVLFGLFWLALLVVGLRLPVDKGPPPPTPPGEAGRGLTMLEEGVSKP